MVLKASTMHYRMQAKVKKESNRATVRRIRYGPVGRGKEKSVLQDKFRHDYDTSGWFLNLKLFPILIPHAFNKKKTENWGYLRQLLKKHFSTWITAFTQRHTCSHFSLLLMSEWPLEIDLNWLLRTITMKPSFTRRLKSAWLTFHICTLSGSKSRTASICFTALTQSLSHQKARTARTVGD